MDEEGGHCKEANANVWMKSPTMGEAGSWSIVACLRLRRDFQSSRLLETELKTALIM